MTTVELVGTWLVEGRIAGQVARLEEPLSFWGGFDVATGRIIDRSHPQHGLDLTDRVVLMPGSKGSSGTPGVFGESLRRGSGPQALIVTKADVNLVAGALTAKALYGVLCPILLIDRRRFESLNDGTSILAAAVTAEKEEHP